MARAELGQIITAIQRWRHSPGRQWSFLRNYDPRKHDSSFPEVDMLTTGRIQDWRAGFPAFDDKTGRRLHNEIAVYIKKRTRPPFALPTQEIEEHSE